MHLKHLLQNSAMLNAARRPANTNQPPCTVAWLIAFSISFCCALQAPAADGPKVQRALPSGGQVGKTHEVDLKGTFASWPVQFWADSADLTIQATETSGKISVMVSPQAEPGVHYFRAYDAAGASDPIPFLVDRCADLLEQEPNDHHAQSQSVEQLPVSVHGCLEKSGDVDTFRIALRAGQTLIASLDGQRFLGSPMDADMQLLTASGVVLTQQLDHHGLDPELKFTASTDGDYLVRLVAFPSTPDSTIAYAGGEKFVYRLMMTTGPYIETTSPACLSRLQANVLQLIGANIQPNNNQLNLPALELDAKSTTTDRKWFSVEGYQGVISLPITSGAVLVEAEPNELTAPQQINAPCIITGCISTRADRDSFQFSSESGQRWKLSVEAAGFGSPLDSVLTVLNSEGKPLATSDDVGGNRDATVSFTAPATGNFTVSVHDMYRHSGPQYWYRLLITNEATDYSIATSSNSFTGKVGQPIEIPVNVARQLDFDKDITVSLDRALPAGVVPQAVSKKADDSGKQVKLIVQSDQPFSGPVQIVSRSESIPKPRIAKPENSECNWLWLTIVQ